MNIFEKIKPKATHSKNGFDLSSRQIFSAKAGQLLPILTHEVIPGDYFEIDVAALSRTMPLNKAAFARIKQYFHFFFVPYQQLWTGWNSFESQRYDPQSSRDVFSSQTGTPFNEVPYFNIYTVMKSVRDNEESGSWEEFVRDYQSGNLLRNFFEQSGSSDYIKLLDYLGYGGRYFHQLMNECYDYIQEYPSAENLESYLDQLLRDFDKNLNPFRILAYNKIYNDFYTNPYYDIPNPNTFNVDKTIVSTQNGTVYSPNIGGQLYPVGMRIKYRRWPNDYFMGLMPSSQFGDIVTFGSLSNFQLFADSVDDLTSTTNFVKASTSTGRIVTAATGGSSAIQQTFTIPNSGISVLDLRQAEQLQKWRETTMRAGRKFADQTMAHYGEKPRCCTMDQVQYLGGFSSTIKIDEVLSTASTADAGLADIAGKGISALQGNKIKFKNEGDFGVLMCIYSAVPMSDYNSLGFDKANTLHDRFDFYTEEFENLGLEPIMRSELFVRQNSGVNQVFGYNVRNAYLKCGIDKVHDSFVANESLSSWCSTRIDLARATGLTSLDFHINPKVLDSIFVLNSDDNTDTDHILINSVFDIKAIRKMSVVGLPY